MHFYRLFPARTQERGQPFGLDLSDAIAGTYLAKKNYLQSLTSKGLPVFPPILIYLEELATLNSFLI